MAASVSRANRGVGPQISASRIARNIVNGFLISPVSYEGVLRLEALHVRSLSPRREGCANGACAALEGRVTEDVDAVAASDETAGDGELRRPRAAAFPHDEQEATHRRGHPLTPLRACHLPMSD